MAFTMSYGEPPKQAEPPAEAAAPKKAAARRVRAKVPAPKADMAVPEEHPVAAAPDGASAP